MSPGVDVSDALEIIKGQLEIVLKRLDAAESRLETIMKREEETGRMLSGIMETMQQMGVLSQPYRKEEKGSRTEDRAYW